MTVYIDYKIHEPDILLKTHQCWHNLYPLLAIVSYDQDKGGILNIYQDDGVLVAGPFNGKSGSQITGLTWNPLKKYLSIGWDSGDLTLWCKGINELIEITSSHNQAIILLCWNSLGNRLVTVDNDGTCIGWKQDSLEHLSPIYHHELKDSLLDIIFRDTLNEDDLDLTKLIQNEGTDDNDLISSEVLKLKDQYSHHSKNASLSFNHEPNDFYLAAASGIIFYVNENGSCGDVAQMDGAIKKLLHSQEKDMLIAFTDQLTLALFEINKDGTLRESSKVKLSGRDNDLKIIWAGPLTLAISTGDNQIRMWNIESGHNFVLSLEDSNILQASEIISSLAFEREHLVLVVATSHGRIIIWKNYSPLTEENNLDETHWKHQLITTLPGAIKSMSWSLNKAKLAIITTTDAYILTEQQQCFCFKDETALVQLSAHSLYVESFKTNTSFVLNTEIQCKLVSFSNNHIVISGENKIVVYEIVNNDSAKLVGSFNSNSQNFVAYEQSLYFLEGNQIEVRTYQGTLKQSLRFSTEEGDPICMDICSHFLVAASQNLFLKVWDLSRREARAHSNPKYVGSLTQNNWLIKSVKINCKGNKVSFLLHNLYSRTSHNSDYKLHIWDLESDSLIHFNFSDKASTKTDDEESEEKDNPSLNEQSSILGNAPYYHCWDPEDAKLLVCETSPFNLDKEDAIKLSQSNCSNLIISFYVTSEKGILFKDSFPTQAANKLLAIHIPFFYILPFSQEIGLLQANMTNAQSSLDLNNIKNKDQSAFCILKQPMREFDGLEKCDKASREAIMNFSFYLTCGNMDEAFKSIRVIKNEAIWKNLGQMCVKTKRLDVAMVCLGKMSHARGARALRQMSKAELSLKVAILAINLGMIDEAEQILRDYKHFDKLNLLYQDTGQWEKAINLAATQDRIHLRNTFYNYALTLESQEKFNEAIELFEKSGTHHYEIPRMLFDDISTLEDYIVKNKDKQLFKWWAHYLESVGEMDPALHYYELAEDYFSLVRVYCYCNNLEKASMIANESGDKAACFHLGRHFENIERTQESIHFFTRAQAYSNAMRICKEHELDDQLLNLALLGEAQEMVDAAHYYQNKPGYQDRAIMLYHKAGHLNKAIELAFNAKEYGSLQVIANDLGDQTDPMLLEKCSVFFMENGQYEKAVDLLATAKNYEEALNLCVKHNVPIMEDLADKLTVEKTANNQDYRNKILEKIGECCFFQENYNLAAKKFTQAGNRLQAMKSLLKSGDVEKITFFANVSRQKELYIMAANYLQSANWRQDPEIMKNIINFYAKGKALDLLAGFYDACAQIEIDEYQNYEKALKAVTEAHKCLSKLYTEENQDQQIKRKIEHLNLKMKQLKCFVQIKQLYETNQAEAIKQCQLLLNDPDIEIAVRKGDVFGFVAEHYANEQNYKMAYSIIQEMQAQIPGVNLPYFIENRILKQISNSLNVELMDYRVNAREHGDSSDNEIEEDI